MSIVNQIPPLNLTPILIILYDIAYGFASNRDDILDQFDEDISNIDEQIASINEAIRDAERGFEIDSERLNTLNVNTEGCSVSDKNKRKNNIINALENRKSELETQRNELINERNNNETFYGMILGTLGDILNTLVQLLSNLLSVIGLAISAIETVITSLASIPLGAGLSAVSVFGFIKELLQTKIFEPVSDTVDQQKEYDEGAPIPDELSTTEE